MSAAQSAHEDATRQDAGREDSAPRAEGISVIVAGGGTAGHIEPALAVADALRRLAPGTRVRGGGGPPRRGGEQGGRPRGERARGDPRPAAPGPPKGVVGGWG
ncbi:glycosyltransferase, partial [Nocardia carnea]|uniref:glycosyltransferase n=1 Tax=Nocardia carnea TaxID=37328 RepID=UPI003D7942E0